MGGLEEPAPGGVRSLGIVGIGLIGGSLALSARRADPRIRLTGVDRGVPLERAGALGVFDRLETDLASLADVELVVLAAPVRQNALLIARLAEVLESPVIVTDTGSTKRAVLEAARALPGHVSFVGGHPLAGAAAAGAEFARADLFDGRPWLLTPSDATHGLDEIERVAGFVRRLGALPRVIDGELHDRVFAFLSHLPQLTASALMHVVGTQVGERDLALAGAGLIDTTRLAASPPAIWRDICATNADAIAPALDALIATLQRLRDDLAAGDAVAEIFGSAGKWRDVVDEAVPRTPRASVDAGRADL